MKQWYRQRMGWRSPLCTITLLAAVGAGCLTTTFRPPDDPLKPRDLTPVTWHKAPRHPPVELVRDRKTQAVVYVADPKLQPLMAPPKQNRESPSTFSQLLANLVESVNLATGANLPVVTNAPAADQTAIVIGDCAETRTAGIDAAQIPAEGFVVRTAPNRVYLVGSTVRGDGTCWAIADFLERFVGVRWYWPTSYGGRSVPRLASLAIPPVHYSDQPVFPYRTMYQEWYFLQARSGDEEILPMASGTGAEGAETLWMGDHFRLMRHGNSWPFEPMQQGARIYEFMNDTLRTNTALFAIREDGSRNYSTFCYSAPELLACYLENLARAWDKGGKHVYIGGIARNCVTLWPCMDLGGHSLVSACLCQPCQEMAAKGGDALIMGDFVRRLCVEVKRRWPDKKVIYIPWSILKCPEVLTFPDNLVVNSIDLGAMGLLHQPAIRREQEGLLRMWAAKSGRPVGMWIDFAGPGDWTYGPVQFPHLVQEFYRTNRNRLAGGQISSYATPCFVTAAPTYYVWNRSLWNPDVDVEAVLDELCKRLFGAGAAPARELLRLECDRWENTPLSRPIRVGEQRVPPKLFREIWPPDVVARMKTLRDDALEAIDQSGDTAARRAFLYWTWTFDKFVAFAEEMNEGMSLSANAAGGAGTRAPASVPPAPTEPGRVKADADAEARFRGGSEATNMIQVANIRRTEAAVAGQSDLRFDLIWGHTWRAKWTEPAETSVAGKTMPMENWSAAWVFAKYRIPGQETNGYFHATLSPDRTQHKVPDAVTLDVGLTAGKGMGVFLYRAKAGHGPLDLKDVRLCWLHGADGVTNPAAVDLKVFALEMVYVPRGEFVVGSGGTEKGSFTDGAWTDGATIPFLVDANWSGPAAEGSNARRIGGAPGRLWGTSEFGKKTIGPEGAIVNSYPTGYEPFYCMRYEVTRGQFTAFLNTMSSPGFAATSAGDAAHGRATYTAAGRYGLMGVWPKLKADRPYQACNLLSWWDGALFAAWAGLRPMTELEYEKACRGPRKPVTDEFAWGTAGIAHDEYEIQNEGQADERVIGFSTAGTNAAGRAVGNVLAAFGNAQYDLTLSRDCRAQTRNGVNALPGNSMRAGIFATPDSDRAAAGASYWGILELSGNLRDLVVTVGSASGRVFEGSHGAGTPEIPADWPQISGQEMAAGTGYRGGFFGDLAAPLRVSDRSRAVFKRPDATLSPESRSEANGWRGVRSALESTTGSPATAPVAVQVARKIPRLAQAVKADGGMEEWTGRPGMVRRSLFQVFPEDRRRPPGRRVLWEGPKDLGVQAWWGWDGVALCLAAEVADDRHVNTQTGGMIWNGDAMQVGIALSTNTHWNLGLALTTNGVVFHLFEGKSDTLSKNAGYAVTRNEAARITHYELCLPLADLGLKPEEPFGFNVVFLDDDDGTGSRYWFQLSPGLCGRDARSPSPWQAYPQFELEK